MSYRPVPERARINLGGAKGGLKIALDYARRADCPGLVRKIKSALKSWDGARRHLRHREIHAEGKR